MRCPSHRVAAPGHSGNSGTDRVVFGARAAAAGRIREAVEGSGTGGRGSGRGSARGSVGGWGGRYRETVDDAADLAPDLAPGDRRAWRRVAAALTLLEAVPLLGVAVLFLGEVVTSRATVVRNAILLFVMLGAIGVALVLVARGLLAGRRWARSPAVTWQILLLAVAWYVVSAGHLLAGLGVAAGGGPTPGGAGRGTPGGGRPALRFCRVRPRPGGGAAGAGG